MEINLTAIKKTFTKIIESDYFWLWMILVLVVYFCGNFFFDFLFYQNSVGGWDGTSHFALSVQYFEKVFPDPFGWIHNWYAGLPWPVGYPPFFYYVTSILYSIFGGEYLNIFKVFVVSVATLTPFITYFVAKKFSYSKAAAGIVAVVISLILFSDSYALLNDSGIVIRSTFNVGLYPQAFALLLFFFWLLAFLTENRKVKFLSIILLALIVLTNIHVAQVALITLASFAISKLIVTKRLKSLLRYGVYLSLAFLLISFWIVPMIGGLNYFPGKILASYPLLEKIPFTTIPIMFISLVSMIFSYEKRNYRMLGVSLAGFAIMIFSVLPWSDYGLNIPLQPFRFFPISMILVCFSIPFTLHELSSRFSQPLLIKFILMSVILLPLITFTKPLSIYTSQSPVLYTDDQKLIEFLKEKTDGRSFIEYFSFTPPPIQEAISSGIGTGTDHQTIWTVFRESSISSFFIVPIRNSLSTFEENYALDCFLCTDPYKQPSTNDFYVQSLELDLKRAELYNIRYFAVRTEDMVKEFNEHPELKLVENFGFWNVYEYSDSGFAEQLMNEPVLTFTDLVTKNRQQEGAQSYDWIRLNEEILFRGERNILLANAKEKDLSLSTEFQKFKFALIAETKFSNLDKSVENIKTFIENGYLFVLSDKENVEFTGKLRELNSENIFFIDKTGDVRNDIHKFITQYKVKETIEPNTPLDLNFGRNSLEISSLNQGSKKIYIKSSYFPYWNDFAGGDVYMASPSSILVLTDKEEIRMNFNYQPHFHRGLIISVLTAIIIAIIFILPSNIEYSMLKFWHGYQKPTTTKSKTTSRKTRSKGRRNSNRASS